MLGKPWIGQGLLVLYFYCWIILNCDVFSHSSQQRCSSYGICRLDLSPLAYAGVNSANSYFPEYFLMAFTLNLSPSDFLRESLFCQVLIWSESHSFLEGTFENFFSNSTCVDFIIGTENKSIPHYFKVSPHADCKGYHYKINFLKLKALYSNHLFLLKWGCTSLFQAIGPAGLVSLLWPRLRSASCVSILGHRLKIHKYQGKLFWWQWKRQKRRSPTRQAHFSSLLVKCLLKFH